MKKKNELSTDLFMRLSFALDLTKAIVKGGELTPNKQAAALSVINLALEELTNNTSVFFESENN